MKRVIVQYTDGEKETFVIRNADDEWMVKRYLQWETIQAMVEDVTIDKSESPVIMIPS